MTWALLVAPRNQDLELAREQVLPRQRALESYIIDLL